ncbi:hypothetical protein B0O99DRAFT_629553 [Bisporella sp. PMI_857]|nr:hypothetical protein B0O99DRAFT_629553 [Bisporella sp. PMI_857]
MSDVSKALLSVSDFTCPLLIGKGIFVAMVGTLIVIHKIRILPIKPKVNIIDVLSIVGQPQLLYLSLGFLPVAGIYNLIDTNACKYSPRLFWMRYLFTSLSNGSCGISFSPHTVAVFADESVSEMYSRKLMFENIDGAHELLQCAEGSASPVVTGM